MFCLHDSAPMYCHVKMHRRCQFWYWNCFPYSKFGKSVSHLALNILNRTVLHLALHNSEVITPFRSFLQLKLQRPRPELFTVSAQKMSNVFAVRALHCLILTCVSDHQSTRLDLHPSLWQLTPWYSWALLQQTYIISPFWFTENENHKTWALAV